MHIRPVLIFIALLVFAGAAAGQQGVRWFWFDDGEDPPEMPLLDSCGYLPVPDGTVISIFWDQNGNGPDPNDPQPPLCNNPPECLDGPAGTVNLTSFEMNGSGYFTSPDFLANVVFPPRFFLRICYSGSLWQSSVVTLVPGLHQIVPTLYSFTCLPLPCPGCAIPPAVTDFAATDVLCDSIILDWSYPDTVTDVNAFKLFRAGSLLAIIPVDSPRAYCDRTAQEGENTYTIQVRRPCLQDSVFSLPVTTVGIRTSLPPMPYDVHASAGIIGCVSVTWEYATNDGLDHWVIRRNQSNVGELWEDGSAPGLRSFVDHPPLNQVFAYAVRGVGICGTGAQSWADSGGAVSTPTQSFSAYLYRASGPPLSSLCVGGLPLPDGTPVWIYWDSDGDGPDPQDPLPPDVCSFPCATHRVNFNHFAMNGEEQGLGAGFFSLEENFGSLCGVPNSPRYFLRICLPDRHWESAVFTLAAGEQEIDVSEWTCYQLPCTTISVEPRPAKPQEFRLDPLFPNPFNSAATIQFALPHKEHVQIHVFDVTGKRTATLLDRDMCGGEHRIVWEAAEFPSGLYFVSVAAGAVHHTQKLVLLK